MSANGKIGIAIQGAGTVSSGHLRAYLRNPHREVVAIGSRTKEGAARKAREVGIDPSSITLYDSIAELVADPRVDARSICTPHQRHATDAIAAARAGKHVLVEKPIAMSADELYAMRDAVKQAGVRSARGFVLRYNSDGEHAPGGLRDRRVQQGRRQSDPGSEQRVLVAARHAVPGGRMPSAGSGAACRARRPGSDPWSERLPAQPGARTEALVPDSEHPDLVVTNLVEHGVLPGENDSQAAPQIISRRAGIWKDADALKR